MSDLYNRIHSLCQCRGISIGKMCTELGISRGNMTELKMERIKTLKAENLTKISGFFGVTVDYLLSGVETEKALTLLGERSEEKAIKIPVLGSVPAGIPIEAIEDILDWEEIPAAMCRGGKEFFALQVKGDSMWPEYLPGDVVIIQKTPCCETGDDCVVYVNGYNATLKTVKWGEDGSLSIIPKNQNYSPKTYTAEEVRDLPVAVAGVVVELRRKKGKQ